MGRDIKLSEERVEGYRNFATKIWNAARFVLMNAAGAREPSRLRELPSTPDELTVADRWICHRLAVTVRDVRAAIDAYRFNEAAGALYQFLWGEYCDWYLELAKISLADEGRRETTLRVLVSVLEGYLRLLHPFMPFVTEELWQALPGEKVGESIMVAPFPESAPAWLEETAGPEVMEMLIEAIRSVRNLRADLNVPPHTDLELLVFAGGEGEAQLRAHEDYVRRLAGVSSIEYRGDGERPRGAATAVVNGMELAIPLAGIIDPVAEIARTERQLEKLEKEMRGISAKLANPQFLERAPAEVIEKERGKEAELGERRSKLERSLERLRSL
jgi:valyl-tRNA synthetase